MKEWKLKKGFPVADEKALRRLARKRAKLAFGNERLEQETLALWRGEVVPLERDSDRPAGR